MTQLWPPYMASKSYGRCADKAKCLARPNFGELSLWCVNAQPVDARDSRDRGMVIFT